MTGGSTNTFVFTFTSTNAGGGLQPTGRVFVPNTWTTPQSAVSTDPGYVTVAPAVVGVTLGCAVASLDSIVAVAGGTEIRFSHDCANNRNLRVTYANAVAPSPAVTTVYTFTSAPVSGIQPAVTVAGDATAPTVTNVTSSKANGSYTVGEVIPIQVVFSESVNVTGTPQLTLETGTSDAVVNYTGGNGTNTLTFTYTVAAGTTPSTWTTPRLRP